LRRQNKYMTVPNTIIDIKNIQNFFPTIHFWKEVNNNFVMPRENDDGHIEYKRELSGNENNRLEKYASQMLWRISENPERKTAIYYIGIDDDGSIVGLSEIKIIKNIKKIIKICKIINARIKIVFIIQVFDKFLLKIIVSDPNYYSNLY
jgi:GTPase